MGSVAKSCLSFLMFLFIILCTRNEIRNSSFGREAPTRSHCLLHQDNTTPNLSSAWTFGGSAINPSFKTREQRGISSFWDQSERRRGELSSRAARCTPSSEGGWSSASKHHKSDQANPGLGDHLFLTQARSRKTKVMSKQIFVAAVLSCVDCGARGPSSGIRRGICPQLGRQTLLLPAWECPSGPFVSQKAGLLTQLAHFLRGRRMKFEKIKRRTFQLFPYMNFWYMDFC